MARAVGLLYHKYGEVTWHTSSAAVIGEGSESICFFEKLLMLSTYLRILVSESSQYSYSRPGEQRPVLCLLKSVLVLQSETK